MWPAKTLIIRPVWSVFVIRLKKNLIRWLTKRGTAKTDQKGRLIWVFAERTGHFLGSSCSGTYRALNWSFFFFFFFFFCPLLLPLRTPYFFAYRVRIYKYKPFIYRKLVYMFVYPCMFVYVCMIWMCGMNVCMNNVTIWAKKQYVCLYVWMYDMKVCNVLYVCMYVCMYVCPISCLKLKLFYMYYQSFNRSINVKSTLSNSICIRNELSVHDAIV